jgi:hypothetical protein
LKASKRTHLLLAQLLWTVIGGVLVVVGTYWVVSRFGPMGLLYVLPLAALGLMKGAFVLDQVAHKAVARIRERGDDRHVTSFFSLRMWAVALAMMALGQLMRAAHVPQVARGFVYVAAGSGLLFASRNMWAAWRQERC